MQSRSVVCSVGALLLGLLAACGGDDGGDGASGSSGQGGAAGASAGPGGGGSSGKGGSGGSSAGSGGSAQAGAGGSAQAGSAQAGSSGSAQAGSAGDGGAGGEGGGAGEAGQSGGGGEAGSGAGAGGSGGQGGSGGEGGSAGAAGSAAGSAGSGGEGGGAAGGGGSGQSGAAGAPACDVAKVTIEHTDGNVEEPLLHLVPKEKYPEALCNDGSPGFYAFRPGFGAGASRWIIYLEGGGNCATGDDCKLRYNTTKFYMSSESIKEGGKPPVPLEGIKSTDKGVNPDFYDANLVQLGYCSSDAWTGDKEGKPELPIGDLGRWHFRGRRIVEAVVTEMLGKGLGQAKEVFLMGSSAGGFGTINNVDDVKAMLPASVRYVSMIDAGFFVNYPAYDPATQKESTAVPNKKVLELLALPGAWGGRGDASCEAAASTAEQHAYCRSPYDLLKNGHIGTPLFIRQSEFDNVQMKDLIDASEKGAGPKAYRLHFAQEMAKELHSLDAVSQIGVFATSDNEHGVINADDEWKAVTVDTLFLPKTLGEWYSDPCGAPVKHIATPTQ